MARKKGKLPAAMRRGHDHGRCVEEAMTLAAELCARRGARLTELRRSVLEFVWQSHAPLGAYAILDMLSAEGRKPMPPTVYRALDFLQKEGLVHRIESLNAFIGCGEPTNPHLGQFLICRECGSVAEMDDAEITSLLAAKAGTLGFQVDSETIEVKGRCSECGNTANGSA